MIKQQKMWLVVFLILTLVLVCGACSKAKPMPVSPVATPQPVTTRTDKPSVAPTPSPTPMAGEGEAGAERMIIRNGSMTLVVNDVVGSMEQITQLARTFSGYVVSSKVWLEGKRTVGNISVRVAAEHFEDMIRALRGMAVDVSSESSSAKDVTEEYVDLEARLRNLEATEKQLTKFLEQTKTTQDALSVQRELNTIRGQIEQTKGRMKYLETSSVTSLVEVRLEQALLGVEITAARTKLDVGEEVQLTSKVAGGSAPYSYEWIFGDGKTSAENNPVHSYKAAGSYTISLKVTDNKGSSTTETRAEYITVVSKPGWSPGGVGGKAWRGFIAFGRVMYTIIVWVGIFGIVWVPVLIAVLIYRHRRGKKKKTA